MFILTDVGLNEVSSPFWPLYIKFKLSGYLIIDSNSEHELYLKSCLTGGQSETLHLTIDETLNSGNCDEYFITVVVEPVVNIL